MAEPDAATETPSKKKSKVPLIIGLFLAMALGGGGFYAGLDSSAAGEIVADRRASCRERV